ncbi:MAG: tetratricopeptide repeat protein [Planctomycetes bacterium]|nr:tetratricopeptide repeat protein [Planctomycetota bacterium]
MNPLKRLALIEMAVGVAALLAAAPTTCAAWNTLQLSRHSSRALAFFNPGTEEGYTVALNALNDALRYDPDRPDLYVLRARIRAAGLKDPMYSHAAEDYEHLRELIPRSPIPYVGLAYVTLMDTPAGPRRAEALGDARRILVGYTGESLETRAMEGAIALESGDPREAEQRLLDVVEAQGSSPPTRDALVAAHFNLAVLRFQEGKFDAATELFTRTIHLDRNDAAARRGLARSVMTGLHTARTREDRTRAVAQALELAGRRTEERLHAYGLDQELPSLYNAVGIVILKDLDPSQPRATLDAAKEAFGKAILAGRDDYRGHFNLALASLREFDLQQERNDAPLDRAQASFAAVLRPPDAFRVAPSAEALYQARMGAAWCAYRRGSWSEVENLVKPAVNDYPQRHEPKLYLAISYDRVYHSTSVYKDPQRLGAACEQYDRALKSEDCPAALRTAVEARLVQLKAKLEDRP